MTEMTRRQLLRCAAAAGVLPAAPWALAADDSYPSRPIKWLLPYLAGTAPDTTARILVEALGPLLGQPVIIENKGGVGGNLGARLAAKSPPDGYTWIYSAAPMAANMRMYKAPGYDAMKDFHHIMSLTSADIVLVVNAQSDIHSFDDLVKQARARPGTLDYASGGIGTPSHLGVEMILSAAHVKALHVPYKGASELVNAVLGQQVTFGAPIFSVAYPHIVGGRLRALAVANSRRNPMLPDVPTLAEAGVPGVELTSWGGVSVPAGTPDAVVARIQAAFEKAMKDPKVIDALKAQGGQIDVREGTAYRQAFVKEMAFTEAMMKQVGLQPI